MQQYEAILKYLAEPSLRPLRSKYVRCWILRLWPRNFAIISESLAANLEKVRQTSVWQTVPKFWFIWLWYLSFCITYKDFEDNKKDKWIQTLEPFVIQRSALPFRGWQPNFQKWLQNFEVITSKFNIKWPPQWPQKRLYQIY